MARKGWLMAENVINTLPLKDVKEVLGWTRPIFKVILSASKRRGGQMIVGTRNCCDMTRFDRSVTQFVPYWLD